MKPQPRSYKDGFSWIALRVPRGVEAHTAVADLAAQVEVALTAIPPGAVGGRDPEPPEESMAG